MMMLCEHCGAREATFYCRSNVNGRVTQVHLCPACAQELGYTRSLAADFFGGDLMGRFFRPLFSDFGGNLLTEFPAPAVETEAPESSGELLSRQESASLQRERQRNSLEVRLKAAVEGENYEEAARLRDELRTLPPQ
jgi:protein-arginine kinase activator protein McsA